jgi:hypothetical protein
MKTRIELLNCRSDQSIATSMPLFLAILLYGMQKSWCISLGLNLLSFSGSLLQLSGIIS